MKRLHIIIIILCLVFLETARAQEVVTGLQSNPAVIAAWTKSDKKKGIKSSDTLQIPFFDDFSKPTVYPDPDKWIDNFVFINNTYSNQQRSEGVATFDAIDNSGRLYERATSSGFMADQLTSKPIILNFSPSDNIYFSFQYEPGGLGDEPEPKDSLTLEFFDPSVSKWYSVWRSEGKPVQPFRAVILPIDNPRFLKRGFQFRFTNYASLSTAGGDPSMASNCDQWNIDYVFLDKNRNAADTIPTDVAFTIPVRSMLKTYEAMPWRQFTKVYLSEMGPWIGIHYQNNDKIVRNVTRNFEITDMYNRVVVRSFSAGATNIDPDARVDYNANSLFTFSSSNPDSALFRVKSYLITDIFDPKQNDTIVYYQKFLSYFAFDDGTSESGYGINGLGSRNAMVAYKFKSTITDTLRAIQICFNDSYLNSNLRTFDLMVWSDDNGIPGNTIYTQEEMTVTQGAGINGFYTYALNDPQEVSGDFYIGWKQRSETFLNAGFDLNTLHNSRQFYWLNGNWTVSQAKGSLMIRPVVGPPIKTTSVNDITQKNSALKIWPNPVHDILNLDPGDVPVSSSTSIKVFDVSGKEVMHMPAGEQINVSSLASGIYFIVIDINGRQVKRSRFIKTR
jgi:hypothetical protein